MGTDQTGVQIRKSKKIKGRDHQNAELYKTGVQIKESKEMKGTDQKKQGRVVLRARRATPRVPPPSD